MTDDPETREQLCQRAAAYAETVPIDVDLDGVTWSVSDRAQRRAGCCRSDGDSVEIRLTWDAYREVGWRQFTATIRHELIHAWQFQQFGRADHGERFAAQADRIDAPRHCESFSEPRLRLRCSRADCEWTADRYRASKPVREPRSYQCGTCGGALVVVHLDSGERWRTAAGYRGARERIDEW